MISLPDKLFSRICRSADTTEYFVQRAGFRHESHSLETSDGYVLGLSRIQSQEHDSTRQTPICLILHGLMSCSDFFVCHLPSPEYGEAGELRNKALPFFLASLGYDVWLLNNRGARYSTTHKHHPLHSDAYWDFSWLDMARLDLPEAVEHIIRVTRQSSMAVCAFSQGTAQLMAALSMRSDLAPKIRTSLLFSPVLVPRLSDNPLLLSLLSRPNLVTRIFGRRSLLWPVELTRLLLPDWAFAWICYTVSGHLFGWRMDQMTGRERSVMYQNIASTTSVKVLTHWLEVARRKTLVDHDFVELECKVSRDTNVYAVIGQDDGLPDHAGLHAFLRGVEVETLTVEGYEHIETIWGRDWGLRVKPFVEHAMHRDWSEWSRRSRHCS